MFLDSDVILSIAKKGDWLAPHIDKKKIKDPVTSSLVIVESELVLMREISRNDAVALLDKMKPIKLKIEPLTPDMVKKGNELIRKYSQLNIFDAFHAGSCMVLHENILSTDHIFDEIEGLKRIDPRNL